MFYNISVLQYFYFSGVHMKPNIVNIRTPLFLTVMIKLDEIPTTIHAIFYIIFEAWKVFLIKNFKIQPQVLSFLILL